MKRKKKLGNIVLTLSAAGMIALAGLNSANAYFTTYAEASGGFPLELGDITVIEEEVSDWTKHFVVESSADSQPVYIRARAFSGSAYNLEYSNPEEGEEGAGPGTWSLGEDGFYYYSDIVNASEKTSELLIKITNPPQDVTVKFNVVVIYESTPVQYHEDGSPYADWTVKLDSNLNREPGPEAGGEN